MNRSADGRVTLGGWLASVVVSIVVLSAAGSSALATPGTWRPEAWSEWVAGRDPVVAALALLRLGALAVAWYVLVVSVAASLLRVVHAGPLVALVDRLTVPALRRLLLGAAGLSLASGISPALAVAPSTTTTIVVEGSRPPPTLTMRLLPPDAVAAPAEVPPSPEPQVPVEVPAEVTTVPTTWTVKPGECFWSIAEEVLVQTWGRPASDAEIVPYWHRLIEANRSVLADRGNPDLVYPAQVFVVPAP